MPAYALRLAAILLVAAALLPAAAHAQSQNVRVINSWDDPVKLDDGSETVYRYVVTYDYTTGVTLRTATDPSGAVVETLEMTAQPGPSPEEIAEAKALIAADPEMSSLMTQSAATVEGGFLLYADQLPACAPPARCLQFDLMPPSKLESVRFVVVDLASRSLVERDLFPDL